MTSFVQLDLFSGPDGSFSTFYVYPEEAAQDGCLRYYIEASGGILLDPGEDDPGAIPLVDIEWVKNAKHSEDIATTQVRDYFFPQFIYDCYREQTIQDLNKYMIGQSKFVDYDANDILHRRQMWSDIRKIPLRGAVPSVRHNGKDANRGEDRPRKMATRTDKPVVAVINETSQRGNSGPLVEPSPPCPNVPDINGTAQTSNSWDELDKSVEESLAPATINNKRKTRSLNTVPKSVEEMDIDVNEKEKELSDTPVRKPKKRKKGISSELGDGLNGEDEDAAENSHNEKKKRKKHQSSISEDVQGVGIDDLPSTSEPRVMSKKQKKKGNDDQTEVSHLNQKVHIEEAPTKTKKKRKSRNLQRTEADEGTASVNGEMLGKNTDEEEIFGNGHSVNKRKKKKKKHGESSQILQDNVNESLMSTQFNEQKDLEKKDDAKDAEIEEAPKKKKKIRKSTEQLEPRITKKRKRKSEKQKESSPEIIELSDDEELQNGDQTDPDETKTKSRPRRSVTSNQNSATNNRKSADNVKKLQENGTSSKRVRRPSTSLGNTDFHEGSELVIAHNVINFDSGSEDHDELIMKGPKVLEAVNKYRKPQKTPVKKALKSKHKHVKSDDSDSDSDTQVTRAANTPAKKNFGSGKAKRSSTNVGLVESSTLREVEISPKRQSNIKVKRFIFDSSSGSSDNGDSDYFPS